MIRYNEPAVPMKKSGATMEPQQRNGIVVVVVVVVLYVLLSIKYCIDINARE